MATKMNEQSLEDLIVEFLVTHNGYEQGQSSDYDTGNALDAGRLERYLRATQSTTIERSLVFASVKNRKSFLDRIESEITRRGVVDVLRKGIRHDSDIFYLYSPLSTGQRSSNIFSVTRQLHYSSSNKELSLDVALFVNGLPVITMELKNRITGQSVSNAIAQYRGDRSPKELLFMPKRCAVHFAVDDEEVAMCTKLEGKSSWFLPFNKGVNNGAGNPVNPSGLKTSYLWEEILTKDRLSDILEHYAQVISEKVPGSTRKKEKMIWPRWHQLEAVRMLLDTTRQEGVGGRYLIQHSAGSGKSNSITWLAYQLVGLRRGGEDLFDSIIIITDRRNLDRQLRDNVKAFTHTDHIVAWSDTSSTLRSNLVSGKKIILTTVQKFSFILDKIGRDFSQKRFAVIIDEAHSSQSGRMSANTNKVLSGAPSSGEETSEDEINRLIEAHMNGRRMAPNASFYAFTATPKDKTLQTFGKPFEKENGEIGHRPHHLYSMKQAIEEGFILDVLKHYTPYESYYHICQTEEALGDKKYERKEAIKKLRGYVERQPETIEKKARVMVEHFHLNVAHRIGGEARCMVCTQSIQRAIEYYVAISRLLKERNSPYKAIIAYSGEHTYHGSEMSDASFNKFASGEVPERFRSNKDKYRFLIVADMYQTGYDEPLLHTMYVDKTLSGLKAVQTLSRLNRTYPGKDETFVLDFANTADDIAKSFQPYYVTTLLSKETDPNKLNDLLRTIEEYSLYTEGEVQQFDQLFWGSAPRTKIDSLLDLMVERFCSLEDEDKILCKKAIKAFIRTYEYLSTILPTLSTEWERKETLLSLLVHKLPKLGSEDLTKGLLEAIDLDRYRLVKDEERSIQLQNEDTEIEPAAVSERASMPEPDMATLDELEAEFNEFFGNIEWENRDIVRRQTEEVLQGIRQNSTVVNSMVHNDHTTADQVCDDAVVQELKLTDKRYTELTRTYWENDDFRDFFNRYIQTKIRREFNPEYDEEVLRTRLNEEFRRDFAEFSTSERYPDFSEVLTIFFDLIRVDTIPDLQGLRDILQRTLNCLYRAKHREEDYRIWYSDLVTRFEAFLKKIYWVREGVPMPLNEEGREPGLLDAVRHFPDVAKLYRTRERKMELFSRYYNVIYEWRNKESHAAEELPLSKIPLALHAAVAIYLYATMVSVDDVKDNLKSLIVKDYPTGH